MNEALFDRSLGVSSPAILERAVSSNRVDSITLAPHVQFDGDYEEQEQHVSDDDDNDALSKHRKIPWAHKSGVQSFVVDPFEGRYALSGSSDASIHLWDLERAGDSSSKVTHKPLDTVAKGEQSHQYGITSLSFYPHDPGLFVSSSYDHRVNVYDTNTLELSASFDLQSKVYSHHMSPVASNVVIATASQHPAIRLVDLRSASTLHTLVGHNGAVMTVAWSPREEFIIASGGSDGTLRLWDIRRSASCLGLFDLEDSTGAFGADGATAGTRDRFSGKAHVGGCNGLAWTEDGEYIVSTGHDERIRVWNVARGSNELSHFGPRIRNRNLSTVLPLVLPKDQTPLGRRIILYPNEREILMFDMFEGTLLKRLRPPGAVIAQAVSRNKKKNFGQRDVVSRITSLAWRKTHLELYSAHTDGHIRAWTPSMKGDIDPVEEEKEEEQDEQEGKKRKALEDIFRSLTKKPITFT